MKVCPVTQQGCEDSRCNADGCHRVQPTQPAQAGPEREQPRCEGRYPVPHRRDEPFGVTYRCALQIGHGGPCGSGDRPQPVAQGGADRSDPIEPSAPPAQGAEPTPAIDLLRDWLIQFLGRNAEAEAEGFICREPCYFVPEQARNLLMELGRQQPQAVPADVEAARAKLVEIHRIADAVSGWSTLAGTSHANAQRVRTLAREALDDLARLAQQEPT